MKIREILRAFKCCIGWHAWKSSRYLRLSDTFPPSYEPYGNPARRCARCSKKQWWFPGYGGSESGCWMGTDKDTD